MIIFTAVQTCWTIINTNIVAENPTALLHVVAHQNPNRLNNCRLLCMCTSYTNFLLVVLLLTPDCQLSGPLCRPTVDCQTQSQLIELNISDSKPIYPDLNDSIRLCRDFMKCLHGSPGSCSLFTTPDLVQAQARSKSWPNLAIKVTRNVWQTADGSLPLQPLLFINTVRRCLKWVAFCNFESHECYYVAKDAWKDSHCL